MSYGLIQVVSKVLFLVLRSGGGGVEFGLKLCYVIYEWPLVLYLIARYSNRQCSFVWSEHFFGSSSEKFFFCHFCSQLHCTMDHVILI